MTGFQDALPATITSAFAFGLVVVMLGAMRKVLATRLEVTESGVDWLMAMLHLAMVPAMLFSGIAVDSIGPHRVVVTGSMITAIGLLALAFSTSYSRTLGSILLIGVGGACLSTASSVLMIKAFYPGNEPASQNMGNVYFGLGALVAPGFTELLLSRFGYRRGLIVFAGICLVPAMAATLTPREAFSLAGSSDLSWAVLSRSALWCASLVLLLYAPLEISLSLWATRYLMNMGFREPGAARLLTGFWLSFLFARLVAALIQRDQVPRMPPQGWVIAILAILAAVAIGNLVGARSRFSAALGILLVGFLIGPIFPTLVGILFSDFPADRGLAYGAMFSIGASGSLLLPPLLGFYARRTSFQKAMRVPMMLAILVAVAGLVLALAD